MENHSPKNSRLEKTLKNNDASQMFLAWPKRIQEDPNESQSTTVVYGFLWVSLGTNQLIPQKAMQNHSVVMVMGSVIFSALITPPPDGAAHGKEVCGPRETAH